MQCFIFRLFWNANCWMIRNCMYCIVMFIVRMEGGADHQSDVRFDDHWKHSVHWLVKSNWEESWDKNTRPLVDQFLCRLVLELITFLQKIPEVRILLIGFHVGVFLSVNFFVDHFLLITFLGPINARSRFVGMLILIVSQSIGLILIQFSCNVQSQKHYRIQVGSIEIISNWYCIWP